MAIDETGTRPANPRFSSGPCAKPPTFTLDKLADAPLGRRTAPPSARPS
jgi:phosphoserine aminotransferase